jgi:hypothetical protein
MMTVSNTGNYTSGIKHLASYKEQDLNLSSNAILACSHKKFPDLNAMFQVPAHHDGRAMQCVTNIRKHQICQTDVQILPSSGIKCRNNRQKNYIVLSANSSAMQYVGEGVVGTQGIVHGVNAELESSCISSSQVNPPSSLGELGYLVFSFWRQ